MRESAPTAPPRGRPTAARPPRHGRNRSGAAVAATVALAWLWSPAWAAAQETFVFRFAPTPGATVRTLTEVRSTTTLTGFPALPDGSALEEERRLNAHHRILAEENGAWLVEAAIDTVWSRRRLDQGAWRDVVDTAVVGRPALALLTSQLAVAGFRSNGTTDGEVFRPVGAMVAGLDFAFPGEPVGVGDTFPTGGRVLLRVRVAEEAGLAVDETVFGDLSLTLDSVAHTGSDDLAYLRFSGALTPRTTSVGGEHGTRVSSFSGAFAGRLVWSRAWNAFVSGVSRVRVEGRVTAETPRGLIAANAVWDTSVRHQVRP